MNTLDLTNPRNLIKKYSELGELESTDGLEVCGRWNSQYDDYSAAINYSVVREIDPKVVLEFGSCTGRCTYDITRALIKNGGVYTFRSYEIDDYLRNTSQQNQINAFGQSATVIGGNILEATDIPNQIEYLFIDNSHDGPTTEWVFNTLLPKCVPGAIVQIHDIPLIGDWVLKKTGAFKETDIMIQMHRDGTLPLEKLYWAAEDTQQWESSWWRYVPKV